LSDESLFREVDEEVRQEQFKKLWARFGNLVIGVCLAIILGVGGWQGWQYWQTKQAQAAGDSFFAATELVTAGKAEDALKQFDSVSHPGFSALSRLREASLLASQGKAADAVTIYDAVAADASVEATLRELARVRAAATLADSASFADIEARLKPFDAEGNPWRHIAREIMASVQWRLKDYAGADALVQAMLGDPETPPSLRQRAQMMAQLLQPLVATQ
jgi:hypothetical protein